jgi:peptide/nickel transport system permease protein
VLAGACTVTFLTFHLLRPELFEGERALPVELASFLAGFFLRLDLGRSWSPGSPEVTGMMLEGLPADAALLLPAILIGAVTGIAGGALCAARPGTILTRVLDGLATFAVCAPVYWVGLVAIYLFSPDIGTFGFGLFGGQGTYLPLAEDPVRWLRALLLPWLVLAAPLAGMCLRMMRVSMGETLREDFMRAALGKGLTWPAAVRRHAVPAGAAPVVSLTGVTMATVVTNAILLEQVFNIPGVLREMTEATGATETSDGLDYPLLQGIVITGACFVVLASLVADLVLGWLDPRVRT